MDRRFESRIADVAEVDEVRTRCSEGVHESRLDQFRVLPPFARVLTSQAWRLCSAKLAANQVAPSLAGFFGPPERALSW